MRAPTCQVARICLGLAVALLGASGCISGGRFSAMPGWEKRLAFHPAKFPEGDWRPTNLIYEDVWFEAEDGTRIHGWYVPHPNPRGQALVLHGNGGNLTNLAESLAVLGRQHRLSVLAFDYRGYGKSAGEPTEQGLLQDARAARAWLAKRDQVAERDVILLGREIGGAVALQIAAEDGARGVVTAATFKSLPDFAQKYSPLMPTWLVMSMRFDAVAAIKRYEGPVLIAHGDADEVVPFDHALALYQAAKGPKQLVTISGGKHNDPLPEEYRIALDKFLADLPALSTENEGIITLQPRRPPPVDIDVRVQELP